MQNMLSLDRENLPNLLINAIQKLDCVLEQQTQINNCLSNNPAWANGFPSNLENSTAPQQYAPMEGANMAKSRIRRRVEIGGKCVWITGSTEQEYAENLWKAMSIRAEPTKIHPFKEYASMWFETYSKPNIERTTAVTYARQLKLHLFPILGDKDIESITSADIQNLFNGMKGRKTTKDKARIVLNMILDAAVDDGIIAKNPAKSKRIRITGEKSLTTEVYTVEQMKFLAQHLPDIKNPQDKMYLALQMFHPLRLEEVLGLKWKDVDLANNLLRIERAVTHPNRNQPIIKETKTESSARTIALVSQVVQYLVTGKPDHFILGGENPLSYSQVRKMTQRIQKDTGFSEKITPIRFRTTVLTDIFDQTKDIKQAQEAAGHADTSTTWKHYVKRRGDSNISADAIATAYGLT